MAVAVILGAVLLGKGFDSGVVASGGDDDNGGTEETTTTTAPGDTTTTAPAEPHPVNEVKVWVLNGGGPQGIAGTATDALNALGYSTIAEANSPVDVPASVVYFAARLRGRRPRRGGRGQAATDGGPADAEPGPVRHPGREDRRDPRARRLDHRLAAETYPTRRVSLWTSTSRVPSIGRAAPPGGGESRSTNVPVVVARAWRTAPSRRS